MPSERSTSTTELKDDKPVMPEGFLAQIPNMITGAVVLSGCVLMMSASLPGYEAWMGVAAFWAGFIADILDGWTARKLKVGTKFGSYFDELADLTAFGIGPAVFFMRHYMQPKGNGGTITTGLAGYLYMLSSVYRISRELVVHRGSRPKFFVGLPTNGGALFLVHIVYIFPQASWLNVVMLFLSIVMAAPVKIFKDPTGLLIPFEEQRKSMLE
eukprot:CAMPEP_0178418284 /NCGR_PEP_ID=MMETSP0689_2-20121128/25008_1 /TAXON_ID=160604 /ORGANISM="Amphidinium massartii, Strain CS-259" /LENGTH=212 /DNA_ID=CAMNT_0020039671 /DNA_START=25 /DNA_END=660 /DNA_ORIENTATION=+